MSLFEKIRSGKATLSDQEEACKNPYWAYLFARCIEGADIEKCQEVVCKDPRYAYFFALDVPGANIEMSLGACKGTNWEGVLDIYLMEKALV